MLAKTVCAFFCLSVSTLCTQMMGQLTHLRKLTGDVQNIHIYTTLAREKKE